MSLTEKIGTKRPEPAHVDDWVESRLYGGDDQERYAAFFLFLKRLPAIYQSAFRHQIDGYKLFCDYGGKRYRCTGASRLGDVWLTADIKKETGYDLRVDILKCSNWEGEG